jgi:EAL domain-containing protein (putative c-di-GMP-specific phosphodiesterase class I)
MLEERSDRAIIKTIISLAEAFELEVVAEGIETQEHYEALLALGCKIFQGYYFARPQRATEILQYF